MKTLTGLLLLLASPAFAQSTADAIIAHELQTSRAYETLSHITDDIGARLSGSRGAALAVAWTTRQFREWGIPVSNEPVKVPHWVRGREEAQLVSVVNQKIVLTAIGGSVATPEAGITAEVIEVDSFDELKMLSTTTRWTWSWCARIGPSRRTDWRWPSAARARAGRPSMERRRW